MNYILLLFVIVVVILGVQYFTSERFQLDHYLRPNYESGANMLRGDLPIMPVQQSWFNTKYGPSTLVPGYFGSY